MELSEVKKSRKESFNGSNIVSEWQNKAYLQGIDDAFEYGLPDIEIVSSFVHDEWMRSKRANGIHSRLSEEQEELMVPYHELSEKSKQLDRNTVMAVYNAIRAAIEEEKSFPGSSKNREGFEG